jgi:uncharacterized protein YkwD
MRRGRPSIVLFVTCALAALGAGTSAAQVERASAAMTRAASLEALVLDQVNAIRATHGMQPFSHSHPLSRAAAAHSRSMTALGYFSHDSQNGTSFADRVKRFYVPRSGAWTVAENLAMFGGSAPTAQAIVAAWMGSPGHRANLLQGGLREAGIAIVHSSSAGGVFGGEPTWVVTLDIGRR